LSVVRQRRRMLKNTNRVLRGNDPNPDPMFILEIPDFNAPITKG
jgi:hypothetical protein